MKYLCLIYNDERALATIPQHELDAIDAECRAHCAALERSGQLLAAERLQPVATATSIRMRNGKASVTDGPFAETREQLGGFYLLQARDLNEAMRIAEKIPPARLGTIEVRPVLE
ncbi:MAG TPA: YciI family protein [Noviherbaspirillum sp.]|nr:YciI family protein [Noviherbaspirillum sp.]